MFGKLAYTGQVLRALAGEKVAELKIPKKRIMLGLGLAAGAHGLSKGIDKAKHYQAEFAPGVAENRIE